MTTVVGAIVQGVFGGGQAFPPRWTETLCGCFDNGNICVEEFFCPWCHLGYLYNYATKGDRQMDVMVCCLTCFCEYFTLGTARCCMINNTRSRLAQRYMIPESEEGCCEMCLKSYCCSCCVMTQMHREMDKRGDYPGGICYNPPPPGTRPMGGPMPQVGVMGGGGGAHHHHHQQQRQPYAGQQQPAYGQPQPAYPQQQQRQGNVKNV